MIRTFTWFGLIPALNKKIEELEARIAALEASQA